MAGSLAKLGVGLSVDDFGTGYASLRQLRRLPLTEVKVDRSSVNGMVDNPADAALISGVHKLARTLGVDVVAEGVEDQHAAVPAPGNTHKRGGLFPSIAWELLVRCRSRGRFVGRRGRHRDVGGDDREPMGGAQIDADITLRVDGLRHHLGVGTWTALRGVDRGRLGIIRPKEGLAPLNRGTG